MRTGAFSLYFLIKGRTGIRTWGNSHYFEDANMEYIRPIYTPERITSLQPGEIFVFGSNLQGMHGGGAARMAYEKFGAIWGKGVGLQGQSYAIPTMQGGVETIRPYVEEFIAFAKEHKELTFLVTPIGCGIAGFKTEDIAPLFTEAIVEENIVLPESFEEVIMQIRPLSKAAIDVLAKRMQARNPYSAGTLSHGIWEHQHYFELLWNSYTIMTGTSILKSTACTKTLKEEWC